MNVELRYEGNIYYEPRYVGVLLEGESSPREMEKEGAEWSLRLNLPEGEQRYKFLINGEMELTDVHNNLMEPDEEGNLWSLLVISEEKQRLYNPEVYEVHLKNYHMQNIRTEKPMIKEKKCFCMGQDRMAVAYLEFQKITGIHSITAAWYAPNGELHEYAENLICGDDENEEAMVCFWMHLAGLEEKQGMWKLLLFVDGQCMMEDLFTVYKEAQVRICQQV